jgi:hypothetical protein
MTSTNIAQTLFITGASIFLCLGILHGVLTLRDLKDPSTFTPPDPALRQAMEQSNLAIHPQTNLWRSWLGFNLSHSLGCVIFGGTGIAIGLVDFSMYARSILLQGCVLAISSTYLFLSIEFWFIRSTLSIGISLACLAIASGLLMFA